VNDITVHASYAYHKRHKL